MVARRLHFSGADSIRPGLYVDHVKLVRAGGIRRGPVWRVSICVSNICHRTGIIVLICDTEVSFFDH